MISVLPNQTQNVFLQENVTQIPTKETVNILIPLVFYSVLLFSSHKGAQANSSGALTRKLIWVWKQRGTFLKGLGK